MSKSSKLSFSSIIGIFKSHFPNDVNLNLYVNLPSFQIQRRSRIIKQSDPATEKHADINKFSGLISAPNMYFRTAYHENTKTVHLLGARSSEFLSGAINDHNYIKYSIKTDGSNEEIEKAKIICRMKINTFNDNYMNMMRNFFTIDVKITDDGSTLFITPYYAHLIKKNKLGKYDIVLKDRAFEPKILQKNQN